MSTGNSMNTPDPNPPSESDELTPESLARLFHDTYERLAPEYNYTTKKDTRVFNPESNNGQLMIAVAGELLEAIQSLYARQEAEIRLDEMKRAKSLYFRSYKQTVTDSVGNVYVDDSHGYISSYEVQERILELKAQLTQDTTNTKGGEDE